MTTQSSSSRAGSASSGSILIALGGNSISPPDEEGTIEQQFAQTTKTMREVSQAIRGRFGRVVISHGNGPQIGNIILRSELASGTIYPLPLDTCVSDSEGGMGYMIQQVLRNVLVEEAAERGETNGAVRDVVSVLTQVVVSGEDKAWQEPTKFIGRDYSEEEAHKLMGERGWRMKPQAKRGWRRVVPSPKPLELVETGAVRLLIDAGTVVIAAGGGGIPVVRDEKGRLHGVECVIDKDWVSAMLALALEIETLVILTGVDRVALDFGKPTQREVARLSAAEAEKYHSEGQFPPGSMGPKIEAAIQFVRNGGKECVICDTHKLNASLAGESGTVVYA